MADRSALGRIGMMLGVATMAVMMVGAVAITGQQTERWQIDDGRTIDQPANAR